MSSSSQDLTREKTRFLRFQLILTQSQVSESVVFCIRNSFSQDLTHEKNKFFEFLAHPHKISRVRKRDFGVSSSFSYNLRNQALFAAGTSAPQALARRRR